MGVYGTTVQSLTWLSRRLGEKRDDDVAGAGRGWQLGIAADFTCLGAGWTFCCSLSYCYVVRLHKSVVIESEGSHVMSGGVFRLQVT